MSSSSFPFTAAALRLAAEAADGMRGEEVFLVINARDSLVEDHKKTAAEADARERELEVVTGVDSHLVLGPCRTANEATLMKKKIVRVYSQLEGVTDLRGLDQNCDGLFWTESSVQKFVLPYYTRIWGVKRTAELWDAFLNDARVFAVGHIPKSEPSLVLEPPRVTDTLDPFKLVFMESTALDAKAEFISLEEFRARR
jgi:hypothetical protein